MQRSGKSHRPILHGFANELLHAFQFARTRRAIRVPQHHPPNLRGAHVARKVDAQALLFEPREILAQRGPVRRDVKVVQGGAVRANDRVVERRNRTAFAGDLGGDALERSWTVDADLQGS